MLKNLKTESILRMTESKERIVQCLHLLDEKQIWQKPNSTLNSVGNLTLHLSGNITQYIHSSLGKEKDHRQRSIEFSTIGGLNAKELSEKITQTIDKAIHIIEQLEETEVTQSRKVQGFEMTGLAIIIHVVEHLSYHTGQIAFWTKYLLEQDLKFYGEMNLEITGGE